VLAQTRPPKASFAYSLFTNDDPLRIEQLDAAVRDSVAALGPHGCAVWATIVRPKVGGRTYAAVNARLRALALDPALSGRLLIADWARAVQSHRRAWLAKDRVHATPAGYLARAQLYADALNSCSA
jgi:lysophospholipase L1-like esterase